MPFSLFSIGAIYFGGSPAAFNFSKNVQLIANQMETLGNILN